MEDAERQLEVIISIIYWFINLFLEQNSDWFLNLIGALFSIAEALIIIWAAEQFPGLNRTWRLIINESQPWEYLTLRNMQ